MLQNLPRLHLLTPVAPIPEPVLGEIVALNAALQCLLVAQYPNLTLLGRRHSGERSDASWIFQEFMPIHKALTVYLYQAQAHDSYARVLSRLARSLVLLVTQSGYSPQWIETLPVTGRTLNHLVGLPNLGQAARGILARRVRWQGNSAAPFVFEGESLGELRSNFVHALRKRYAQAEDRMSRITEKIKVALTEEEFAFFQSHS
jgi:hypothetical protein